MMPLRYIDNESGLTLAELVVSLGLSALLLALVVSGALFVKKYVADWSDRDKVTEELAFIRDEIGPCFESARGIELKGDTLIAQESDGTRIRYWLSQGMLTKDGRSLTRAGLSVDLFDTQPDLLPKDSLSDTLPVADGRTSLYRLTVAVSDRRGNVDTLVMVGRNRYEALKYQ